MSFIDWSDAEGLIDLFQEFVRDESASPADPERHQFLDDMLRDIASVRDVTPANALERLNEIQDSIPEEFSGDPVSSHLSDLIQELERIR